jgi:heme/copper-type cytochrome/quinol oxidase subunit 4
VSFLNKNKEGLFMQKLNIIDYIGQVPIIIGMPIILGLFYLIVRAFLNRTNDQKLKVYFGLSNIFGILSILCASLFTIHSIAFSNFYFCAPDTPTKTVVKNIILQNAYTLIFFILIIFISFVLSGVLWFRRLHLDSTNPKS